MTESHHPKNNRRKFLQTLLTGSMATMAAPLLAFQKDTDAFRPLPQGESPDERYWQMVKKQFAVPPNLVMMNAANLCPSPYSINELVTETLQHMGKDVSFQYRHQFADKRAISLEKISQFVGVGKEEVGIVRNTTEGNSIIVNGLDLKAGDEVILWDQNHPSNNIAWEQRAKRFGFTVKKVTTPSNPQSGEDLAGPFTKAITSKTRLISFSHVSNLTGTAMPARQICQYAKARNILTLVDGAQSLGMMDLNLKDMGCDFYTASTHKWLMGPFENGLVYISKDQLDKIWPTVISAGWKDTSTTVDEKLCVLGQRNETTPFALPEAIDFQLAIGKKVIEERVRKLSAYLKDQIRAKIPQAIFVSPLAPELSAGIVSINIPGKSTQEIYQKLYDVHGIACAASGGVRLSAHIYNTLGDLDKLVSALGSLAA